jgi:threonine dehydrogenase-like Zn-dependent dehydrogenase
MKAVCWEAPNKVAVEHVPDPSVLNPRDAVVRITSTAICGSDLHLLDGFIPTMETGEVPTVEGQPQGGSRTGTNG